MKTPLFSSVINLKLEPELHERLAAAARNERTTTSEFVRRALRATVASRPAAPNDDGPGPFSGAPGMRVAA